MRHIFLHFKYTRSGKRVLLLAGDRYNEQGTPCNKIRWRCIKKAMGCRSLKHRFSVDRLRTVHKYVVWYKDPSHREASLSRAVRNRRLQDEVALHQQEGVLQGVRVHGGRPHSQDLQRLHLARSCSNWLEQSPSSIALCSTAREKDAKRQNNVVEWARSPSGKLLLIVNGYTFSLIRKCPGTEGWRCTRGSPCKALLTLTEDGVMIKSYLQHLHPPASLDFYIFVFYVHTTLNTPVLVRSPKLSSVRRARFIEMEKGRRLLLDGYVFYREKSSRSMEYWRCRKNGCKARVHVTFDGRIGKGDLTHHHPPPSLYTLGNLHINI
ncbi:hypothetical protein EVAR_17916_1 [Eumeta japonica]|uniref:FLYWCH-type domain-containing protein n=1 Tax=Eumeta variegata TaxID=151549 RepID=A0A4C1UZI7_EUMVA|nr:hypothetical protein EVAR_17916_1 [Eumeta japonica]